MKTILFQGDSITDMGRSRQNDNERGCGYPTLVAASLGMDRPGEFQFLNRGIGGNRIIDLLGRVKADVINLKPDYMSILIGVNDAWHEYDFGNGVDTHRFEMYYNLLIEQVREALPGVKIMILEPFLLKACATEGNWALFRRDVEERAAAAKRVAEKNGLIFVPLMKKFDEAQQLAPASYWIGDGVHPNAMGHELIKREWLKAFAELEK